ncbi:MAG: hypothetical protein ACRC0X_07565, partial [Brevinema sp.]
TNNIIYTFNKIKSTNHCFYKDNPILMNTQYQYLGSLSLLERIYLDTNNQLLLITLKPINDSIIICHDKKKFLNPSPVYPSTITLYTNKEGEEFYRIEDYILTPVNPNEFRYKTNLIEI